MPYSYAQFVADGMTDIFNVPFPFIAKAHVTVLVDGVATGFTWHTSATVKLPALPANGAIVRVKRTTPTDEPIATFISGGPIPAVDLNNMAAQNIYALQEFLDNMAEQLAVNASNKWEGRGKVLTNLADPVAPQDAATKAWVLTVPNTTLAEGEAAKTAAEAAAALATQAKLDAQAEVGTLTPRVVAVEDALPGKLDKSLFTAAWDILVGNGAAQVVKKTFAEFWAYLTTFAAGGWTKQQYAPPVAVTPSAGAVTLDAQVHQNCKITSTQNLTMNAPTNAVEGMMLFVKLYAASALTITWNSVFVKNADKDLPTAHTAGKDMFLQFYYDGTNWVLLGGCERA